MRDFGCIHVKTEGRTGLGRKGVCTGGNSGYQAVNLAYLLGASRIVMLGFDMTGEGNRNHWHLDHAGGSMTNPTPNLYREWVQMFGRLARDLKAEGVELLNASRRTAIGSVCRVVLEAV